MEKKKQYIEIIGKKIGMTQFFDQNNKLVPVTLIEAEPCIISQLKTLENDGYNAVQLGYSFTKSKKTPKKPISGRLKPAGIDVSSKFFEFRVDSVNEFEFAQKITVDSFEEGEVIDVIGVSKGKGFQGVVKRFNFGGGRASHGSMTHRRGGSYGQCQTPGEVNKGKKMPGRTGGVKKTIQNLIVVKVVPEKNVLMVKGSCPGYNGAFVRIRRAIKTKKS